MRLRFWRGGRKGLATSAGISPRILLNGFAKRETLKAGIQALPMTSDTLSWPAIGVLRAVQLEPGRHMLASPGDTVLQQLSYGRIVGAPSSGMIAFDTGGCESLLVCRRGLGFVLVEDELYELYPLDSLFIPCKTEVQIHADGGGCELIEVLTRADGRSAVCFAGHEESACPPASRLQLSIHAAPLSGRTEEVNLERLEICLEATELRFARTRSIDRMRVEADDCLLIPAESPVTIEGLEGIRHLTIALRESAPGTDTPGDSPVQSPAA